MQGISIVWMRRDLRLTDHAALYHALRGEYPVLPLFIFDQDILGQLSDPADPRVGFIHDCVNALHAQLKPLGSTILAPYGKPLDVWKMLLETLPVKAVYFNKDYEPDAIRRYEEIHKLLSNSVITVHSFKDHVIFEGDEVEKDDGKPYTVFTPYSKRWKKKLAEKGGPADSFYLKSYPTEKYFGDFFQTPPSVLPSLADLGFRKSQIQIPPTIVAQGLIKQYDQTRDYPAMAGTSRLGIHFRFGTISIREKARHAATLNETYLNELIWRDFYSMILQHFPHVATGAFRPEYERVQWLNDEENFQAWCEGRTGFPIVDAGMRELNTTGHMHNRVRMIVASFLTKHLLIDWRWGEAYFAGKLLDFDLASNNGGWQWAAGCGTDAAPYFRIFNPLAQQERFDPQGAYVRKWVPEWKTPRYVKPIVDLAMARDRCLAAYKAALKP